MDNGRRNAPLGMADLGTAPGLVPLLNPSNGEHDHDMIVGHGSSTSTAHEFTNRARSSPTVNRGSSGKPMARTPGSIMIPILLPVIILSTVT